MGSFEINNGFVVPRKMNFQEAVANGTERTVKNRDTFLSSRTPYCMIHVREASGKLGQMLNPNSYFLSSNTGYD